MDPDDRAILNESISAMTPHPADRDQVTHNNFVFPHKVVWLAQSDMAIEPVKMEEVDEIFNPKVFDTSTLTVPSEISRKDALQQFCLGSFSLIFVKFATIFTVFALFLMLRKLSSKLYKEQNTKGEPGTSDLAFNLL